MRARAVATALVLALALPALPANAEPPAPGPKPLAPSEPITDPAYNPSAHGELPYGSYLLMTRGTRRRSTGMMVGGIIITALGAVAMGTGTGIYFGRGSCDEFPRAIDIDGEVSRAPECNRSAAQNAGVAILAAGAIAVALGVPLWVLGGSDVPWAEAAGRNEHTPVSPAAPAWARLVPVVKPTHRGVGLAWHF